jgi:hypothetical protein
LDKKFGLSIILHQDKNDMGAHRFTLLETNTIVASTDMPDSDDRPATEHYSKARDSIGIFGYHARDKVYADDVRANEVIRIQIDDEYGASYR